MSPIKCPQAGKSCDDWDMAANGESSLNHSSHSLTIRSAPRRFESHGPPEGDFDSIRPSTCRTTIVGNYLVQSAGRNEEAGAMAFAPIPAAFPRAAS